MGASRGTWTCLRLHKPHQILGNPKHQYRLWDEWIDNSLVEDLKALMDEQSYMSWQCALAGQKAICVLGCIELSVASRMVEVILPSYNVLETPSEVSSEALSQREKWIFFMPQLPPIKEPQSNKYSKWNVVRVHENFGCAVKTK